MMANVIPYINFANESEGAVMFYKTVFGGDAEVQKDGERVIQLEFHASDIHFMGSDSEGHQASLVLNCDSEEQLREFYAKLVNNGKEVFAPTDSGWGAIVAHCEDQFSVTWMLNYDIPQNKS